MIKKKLPKLPGDKKADHYIKQAIRVNHAGEYGAKRIYQGQLSILSESQHSINLQYILNQELEHLKYFEQAIKDYQARESLLKPIWNILGFSLGALSALIGEKYAYACTIAIEDVINEHYQDQLNEFDKFGIKDENELVSKIKKFQEEELEHREISFNQDVESIKFYNLFTKIIKFGCKASIEIAKKI